jgi:hypothetical protein
LEQQATQLTEIKEQLATILGLRQQWASARHPS